jgi:hypothetical protein
MGNSARRRQEKNPQKSPIFPAIFLFFNNAFQSKSFIAGNKPRR